MKSAAVLFMVSLAGSAQQLAAGFKAALDALGRAGRN
jgi:hypothetical protein